MEDGTYYYYYLKPCGKKLYADVRQSIRTHFSHHMSRQGA